MLIKNFKYMCLLPTNKKKKKKNKNHLFWRTSMQLQQHLTTNKTNHIKINTKAKPPKPHTCPPDRRIPKDSPEALHWKGRLIKSIHILPPME